MEKPHVTRLRYFSAKKPETLVMALVNLGARIQIYGAPQWDGKRWYLWFVPSDMGPDIMSQDI